MPDRVKADAHGFDTDESASAYERARPSYPAEAVAYIAGRGGVGPGCRVLDLAAGTGKLTRLLVPTGAEVVGVEPMARMREQLGRALPDVEVRDGTAESLPLEDASVDVVTVAQAFHWFDAPVALAEIRRVLVTNGHLFLIWNMRDRNNDWMREYDSLLLDGDLDRPYDSYYDVDYEALVADASPRKKAFVLEDIWSYSWAQPCDEELLLARASSVSVVGVLPVEKRAVLLDRLRHLARTHPDLAGKAVFDFPYTTKTWHFRAQP